MFPRRIGHIWIGPHPAPEHWMQTWRDLHPAWEYTLFDNEYLLSRRFRNQHLINEYVRRGKWAGVADLMRYEILYEWGGFLPEADSICLHQVDALLTEEKVYSVWEYPNGRTGMMSPFLAASSGLALLDEIIQELGKMSASDLNLPWHSTGNGFLKRYFQKNPENTDRLVVFPSHYFIPEHFKGERYTGADTIYARQNWGTTTKSYDFRVNPTKEYKDQTAARSVALLKAIEERHPA